MVGWNMFPMELGISEVKVLPSLVLIFPMNCIEPSEHERMLRSEVVPGDVLFTIAGSIGNACVVSGIEKANINQAIVRVRPRPELLPQYLADFLNSKYGKFQSSRIANGGVQLNINFSEVGQIAVVILPSQKQAKLVAVMNAARTARQQKLVEADTLLAGFDSYLLTQLGLTAPVPDARKIFAVRLGQLHETGPVHLAEGGQDHPRMAAQPVQRRTQGSAFNCSPGGHALAFDCDSRSQRIEG